MSANPEQFDVKRYLDTQEAYHKAMAENVEVIRTFGEQMVEVHKNVASTLKEQRAAVARGEAQGHRYVERFGLVVRAFCIAKGDGNQVGKILQDNLRAPHVAAEVDRFLTAERSLQVQNPTNGGFAVPTEFFDELIPLLRPVSSLMQLGARHIPLSGGGSIIPRLIEGSIVEWVGESEGAARSNPKFGAMSLNPKKMMGRCPISNDWLIATAGRSVNQVVAQDVTAAIAQEQSRVAFNGSGPKMPIGLFTEPLRSKLTTPNVPGWIGGPKTLRQLISAWKKGNYGATRIAPGIVMNEDAICALETATTSTGHFRFREEMAQGRIWRLPFVEDHQLITDEEASKNPAQVAVADWAEYFVATFRGIELAYSTHSLFGTDESELRAIWSGDMGPRQLSAFAVDELETEE